MTKSKKKIVKSNNIYNKLKKYNQNIKNSLKDSAMKNSHFNKSSKKKMNN